MRKRLHGLEAGRKAGADPTTVERGGGASPDNPTAETLQLDPQGPHQNLFMDRLSERDGRTRLDLGDTVSEASLDTARCELEQ